MKKFILSAAMVCTIGLSTMQLIAAPAATAAYQSCEQRCLAEYDACTFRPKCLQWYWACIDGCYGPN